MSDPRPAARVAEVLALVVGSGPRPTWPSALVRSCQTAVGAAGVGLMSASASGPVGVVATTPGPAQAGEELQFALGEGPCRDATHTGRVVRVPDLTTDGRWVLYAREAAVAGIAAQVSVPLSVGAVRVGVLTAYLEEQGGLDATAWAALQVHAEAATAVLLLLQAEAAGDDPVADVTGLADIRPVVHQAAGRVAVQLDVDLPMALLRLRAHAFGEGRLLHEVAADVGAHRLVFDHTPGGFTRHPAPDHPSPTTRDDDADT